MKARYHLLFGGVAASLLLPRLEVHSLAFFASSILIDGDHYLDYVLRNGFKDFNLRRMFVYNESLAHEKAGGDFIGLNIGHTAEFILALYVAGAVTGWAWLQAVFWGVVFHVVADLVYLFKNKKATVRAISIVEYFVRLNAMQRRGLRPELTYTSAIRNALAFQYEVNKAK